MAVTWSLLQQLPGDGFGCGRAGPGIEFRIALAEKVKQAFDQEELPHLGGHGAGLKGAFVVAAEKHHIREFSGPGLGKMGDQYHRYMLLFRDVHNILHIPGGSGIGEKEDDVSL